MTPAATRSFCNIADTALPGRKISSPSSLCSDTELRGAMELPQIHGAIMMLRNQTMTHYQAILQKAS